jgi:plastocyanin
VQTAERLDRAVAEPARTTGLGWRELLVWLAIVVPVVLIAGMVALGEVIPPLILFAVIFLVGAFLARRPGKPGPILLGVLAFALVGMNAPFVLPALAVPASTVDFLLGSISTIAAIATLVASIAVLRGSAPTSRAPRAVALGVVGLIILMTGVAVVARITYAEPVAASGDVRLTTQDIEFVPATISADAGAVTVFVTNEDPTLHTFTIEELGVDLQIPGGSDASVTFDAEPGTYEFVCTPHEGMGMTGTLEVR